MSTYIQLQARYIKCGEGKWLKDIRRKKNDTNTKRFQCGECIHPSVLCRFAEAFHIQKRKKIANLLAISISGLHLSRVCSHARTSLSSYRFFTQLVILSFSVCQYLPIHSSFAVFHVYISISACSQRCTYLGLIHINNYLSLLISITIHTYLGLHIDLAQSLHIDLSFLKSLLSLSIFTYLYISLDTNINSTDFYPDYSYIPNHSEEPIQWLVVLHFFHPTPS